jgi:D-mannonate dehydratase
MALHSLCIVPQLLQQNRRRSPIVRIDHGWEWIDDSSMKPLQTGHGRLKCTTEIS